jgi:hypothetical protein
MNYDKNKVDDAVLALMFLTLHDQFRAWKGFDWDTLDRLYDKGLIGDPKSKARSVVLTEEGLARSEALFRTLFVGDAPHVDSRSKRMPLGSEPALRRDEVTPGPYFSPRVHRRDR